MSVESPQLEDGYLKIVLSIAEALARTQLSGYESRVLWFLWRKTYGWSKKSDLISLSQWVDGTGIDKKNVQHTIKRLLDRRIIYRYGVEIHTTDTRTYEFNKHFGEWKSVLKSTPVLKSTLEVVLKSTPTIERSTTTEKRLSPIIPKVGKRKKPELTPEESEVLSYLNLKADNSFTAPGEIGKRLAEGHTVEECKTIIDKKVAEWLGTDFAKNLNPTTLFRLCHFDTYLHQKGEASMKKFSVGEVGKSNMGEEWG
ncbi:MAG: replication protein [Patescibacteria group bacterium]|jgi:phage replication O-like protein O